MTIINAEMTTYNDFLEFIEECVKNGFNINYENGKYLYLEKEIKRIIKEASK